MTAFLQNLIDAISVGSTYALVALGIALIFGIMRLVNMAYGEIIMIGGYVLYALSGIPWVLAVALAIATTIIVAIVMERSAFRPVRGADPTTLLITSFVVSFFLQHLALVALGSIPKAIPYPSFVLHSTTIAGLRVADLNLVTIVVVLILLVGLVGFLRKTTLGMQMRAAAEDFTMAQLVGVRANRVIAAAFGLSGLIAGVISVLYLAQLGTVQFDSGVSPLLIGVVATVTGGLGSLLGAALGGYGIGLLQVMLQSYLPSGAAPWRDAFVYTLVIVILLLRPQGLLVRSADTVRA
jgi:branched-chain amino acid transport system permease protein